MSRTVHGNKRKALLLGTIGDDIIDYVSESVAVTGTVRHDKQESQSGGGE